MDSTERRLPPHSDRLDQMPFVKPFQAAVATPLGSTTTCGSLPIATGASVDHPVSGVNRVDQMLSASPSGSLRVNTAVASPRRLKPTLLR